MRDHLAAQWAMSYTKFASKSQELRAEIDNMSLSSVQMAMANLLMHTAIF